MVRFATAVLSILMLSACSSSEGTPAAAAPAETPAETPAAANDAPAPAPTESEATPPPADAPPAAAAAAPAPATESASALSFRSVDGRNIKIEDYLGKPVAVMFFSTDCPHCQNTAQILGPIYQEYKQKGVEILGIAVNPTAQTNLPAFVARYRVDFPVGLGNSVQWATFAKFSITKRAYVPHILFVGKDGEIAEDHPGEDQAFWQDQATNIAASFDRLLAE